MISSELNKIATHPLQTSYWAEFRNEWGNKILTTKYGILTLHPLPFIKIFTGKDWKVATFIKGPKPTLKMMKDLKKIAKDNNLIFIKMEPNIQKEEKIVSLLRSSGAIPGKTLFTPTTFWIDLTPNEDSILKSFSGKTRYNIKVAQKHGVTIKEDNSDKAFNKYLDLTSETVARQGFYAHSRRYHKLMWETLHKNQKAKGLEPIAHLFTAIYKNKIITTWILFRWNEFLYYPYGASTEENKNVMANNLMMWEVIKFGKKMGLTTFDLWGREEGKGFTKFKEGYNPKVVEFLGTWDFVTNKTLYKVYKFAEALRWPILRIMAKITTPTF